MDKALSEWQEVRRGFPVHNHRNIFIRLSTDAQTQGVSGVIKARPQLAETVEVLTA